MFKINNQPISKIAHGDGQSLEVNSVFFTIQGEGPNVGRPAVFVRLAGCNLQCPGCDTSYSDATQLDIGDVFQLVADAHASYRTEPCLVVITGGEPFRQNIIPFIDLLTGAKYEVQVETNGTVGYDSYAGRHSKFDIVVSPKAGKVNPALWSRIIAYKYVVNADDISDEDGLPTSVLGMPASPARPYREYNGPIYVQPADEPIAGLQTHFEQNGLANRRNLEAAINSCMRFGYILCIQTHKIIGLD